MRDQQFYNIIFTLIAVLLLVNIFFVRSFSFILVTYIFTCMLMIIRTVVVPSRKRTKTYLITVYIAVMFMQITLVTIAEDRGNTVFQMFIGRLFGAVILFFPFMVERFVTINKYASFYLPPVGELSSISFAELKYATGRIAGAIGKVTRAGKAFSPENLEEIKKDLGRHNSFQYINKGVLTDEYFNNAAASLSDEHLYVIISNTGSPASEIIGTFTQKQYNHASLSFDRDLTTTISYNGGERVYPPGINHEMLEFFNKKEDASIIVYRLDCTRKQKSDILEKIREINREGSAYNMMGLVVKYSHKPNIMFCSQFVYKMLSYAGLNYFEKPDGAVKPTDLIELDYYRKLQFEYELKLNQPKEEQLY